MTESEHNATTDLCDVVGVHSMNIATECSVMPTDKHNNLHYFAVADDVHLIKRATVVNLVQAGQRKRRHREMRAAHLELVPRFYNFLVADVWRTPNARRAHTRVPSV